MDARAIAASFAALALAAHAQARPPEGPRFGYVGQVVNGSPAPASSVQFGNLTGIADGAYTFYTEATTTSATANGPLRIVERAGTTTIYAATAPGDFAHPESFRSGAAVHVSRLRPQVVVDTSTGAFTVLNMNTVPADPSPAAPAALRGARVLRSVLTGHLNAPGTTPTGWFGGYAIADTGDRD